jgi:hypothetical protein
VQTLAGYLFGTESVCGWLLCSVGRWGVTGLLVFSAGGCVWLFGWLRRTEAKIGDPFYRPMLVLLGQFTSHANAILTLFESVAYSTPAESATSQLFLLQNHWRVLQIVPKKAHTMAGTFSLELLS